MVKYRDKKNKTKQKTNNASPIMSCMSLSGPDCWVNWFQKLIGIKAGGEVRRHSFSSRICFIDELTWVLSTDYLPTSTYQGEEVDCVPVKLCNVPELEPPCCGAERGGKKRGGKGLFLSLVRSLRAGDWRAAFWSSRDQGNLGNLNI